MMLHSVAMGNHWFAARLLQLSHCGTSNTNFQGYRECKTALHQLFAKHLDVNIIQWTSKGSPYGLTYLCVADLTRSPFSVTKPSNYNVCILLVHSHHTRVT